MRVAVCDPVQQEAEQVAVWIRDIEFVSQCDTFSVLSKIIRAVELGGDYDIILMTIVWGQAYDGIEAARKISRMDARAQIIYMGDTVRTDVQELFLSPVNLSGFLTKPVSRSMLERNFIKARATSQKPKNRRLEIKYKNEKAEVLYKDILYLESMGHLLVIHTQQRDYHAYNRLEQVLQALPDYFLHCHKSYAVNMNYVRSLDKKRILLFNGKDIPISRARYNESRDRYLFYTDELLRSVKHKNTGDKS